MLMDVGKLYNRRKCNKTTLDFNTCKSNDYKSSWLNSGSINKLQAYDYSNRYSYCSDMAIANITENGREMKYEELFCSADLNSDADNRLRSLAVSAVNIFLSVTAFLGNTLILLALHKEERPNSVQTLVSLSGDIRPLCWSCFGAPRCHLLDVYHLRTLEFLWNVFVDYDRNKCGPASRPVVET